MRPAVSFLPVVVTGSVQMPLQLPLSMEWTAWGNYHLLSNDNNTYCKERWRQISAQELTCFLASTSACPSAVCLLSVCCLSVVCLSPSVSVLLTLCFLPCSSHVFIHVKWNTEGHECFIQRLVALIIGPCGYLRPGRAEFKCRAPSLGCTHIFIDQSCVSPLLFVPKRLSMSEPLLQTG